MITEDYCSYEVSKLLKEKGFDAPCFLVYLYDGTIETFPTRATNKRIGDMPFDWKMMCVKPTHALAMKWLRKKGIYINIRYVPKSDVDNIDSCYVVDIANDNTGMWVSNDIVEKNYEEAVEAALKFCLTELI